MLRRRALLTAAVTVPAASLLTGGVAAAASSRHGGFPTEFALPPGFQPEGIAIGGHYAYLGSRADGRIYRADLRTGTGVDFSAGPGTPSLGLKVDGGQRLFVAGGTGGNGRVISIRTGAVLANYQFTTAPAFINDVVLTCGSAWFTDSRSAALFRVPLSGHGGSSGFSSLPLSGDFVLGAGNNANGIADTPDRDALLIVQSNTGLLLRVDPRTGVATTVDLGGALLTNGDGLLRRGRTLYAVQNRLNQIAVIELDRAGSRGRITGTITDPRFDVPTTVAEFGGRLYLPNARFSTPPTPTTPYAVIAVRR